MEKKLEFLESYTVGQFKSKFNLAETDKIRVKQFAESGKCFFSAGAISGKVAKKGYAKAPLISKVKGEPDEYNADGVFWLLHNEGENAKVTIVDEF